MTISERIFEILKNRDISQKAFSEMTGISTTTISDWKRKNTNPSSDKILIICNALDVSPEELLSGTAKPHTNVDNSKDYIVIPKNTELGQLIVDFQAMDENQRGRVLGYFNALKGL